jgi:sortase (surface protein transpeptidase)
VRRISIGRRGATAAALALVAVVLASGAFMASRGDGTEHVAVAPPAATPAPATCSTAQKAFVPTAVSIPGIDSHIPVLPLAREASGVPATPPLTTLGKASMAFDLGQHVLVGAPRGNALLNAHTYPDDSALGNKLLDKLHKGDQIIVRGVLGKVCYQVNDRVEVPAEKPSPRYFDKKGQPQIAIVVCSGQRLGPGVWTKRTLFFASPVV